jgi:hypothetical protein
MAATQCFFLVRLTAVTRGYFTWLVDGGRECLPLAWCDRQNSDARRKKHYTNIGIHNDYYTLAITVIDTIRFYRMEYNRKQ